VGTNLRVAAAVRPPTPAGRETGSDPVPVVPVMRVTGAVSGADVRPFRSRPGKPDMFLDG
jgi:hypothetical protein